MENMGGMDFVGTRHSIKPKGEDSESEKFKGISERGEQLARERAHELLQMAEEAPEGAVIFFGGASDQIRTKSTAEVYGQEMKSIVAEEGKDILVLNREDIADREKGYSQIVTELVEKINSDPKRKVVVDFPMFLKEFSIGGGKFLNADGSLNDFTKKLLEISDYSDEESLRNWIKGEGMIEGIEGPKPEEIAKDHVEGVRRLLEFAKKQIGGDRPIIIGFVGHSWSLDVMATYLANEGHVTLEGYEKTSGAMIKETQPIEVKMEGDKMVMKYGDKEFAI